MIRSLIPYHTELEETPLYQETSRPITHRFWWGTLTLLARVIVVVLVLYGLSLIDDWQYDGRIYVSGYGVFVLFLLSVLAMLYADYAGVRSGQKTVRDALFASSKGKLEDMMASPADKAAIYHAIARLGVWRLTMGIVGLRSVVAVLALLELKEKMTTDGIDYFNSQFVSQIQAVVHPAALVVLMALTLTLYIIEPLLRTGFTTVFGLLVTLRRDEGIFQTPGSLRLIGYWIGLYIAFAIAMGSLSNGVGYYGVWITGFLPSILSLVLALSFTVLLFLYQYRSTSDLLKQTEIRLADIQQIVERREEIRVERAYAKPSASYYPFQERFFAWMPLLKMLNSRNPVFAMEARHLKRGRTLSELRKLTGRVLFRLSMITLILTLGLFVYRYQQWWNFYTTYSSSYYYKPVIEWEIFNQFMGTLGIVSVMLAAASIGGSLFLDFSSLTAGMNAINRDMVAGRWDLLRLTMLPERQILMAKHSITQVRAWGMVVWISGMRSLSLLILLGLAFVDPPYPGARSPVESVLRAFIDEPILSLLVALGTLGFVIVYLLEPFWRFQSMTAMALSVSAGRNPTNSILMGLGAILGVWISQAVIAVALGYAMFLVAQFISFILRPAYYYDNYELMNFIGIFGAMIACFVAGAVIFTYYSILQRFNLNRLRSQAFKT